MEKGIFDEEFCSKLKAFYSFEEGERVPGNMGYRRSGRTKILARILLETAIESGRELIIQDHYLDVCGVSNSNHCLRREIENAAREYRDYDGVHINLEFHRSLPRFKAWLMDGKLKYHQVRTPSFKRTEDVLNNFKKNPFPVDKLQEQKHFLEKQLLLL